jgi:hypothetical protein
MRIGSHPSPWLCFVAAFLAACLDQKSVCLLENVRMDNAELETKRQGTRGRRRTDQEMMAYWGCAGIGVGKRQAQKVLGRGMVTGVDI